MKRIQWISFSVAVCAAALSFVVLGCKPEEKAQPPQPEPKQEVKQAEPSVGQVTPSPVETPKKSENKGGTPSKPEALGPNSEPKSLAEKQLPTVPAPSVTIAPPKSDGWLPASIDAKTLGKKIDSSMLSLKQRWVETQIQYKVPGSLGGNGMGKGELLLQDSTHFAMQYVMPSTREHRNRALSDGTNRVQFLGDKWSNLPPYRSQPAAPKLSDEQTKRWVSEFPKEAFGVIVESRRSWQQIMEAWSSGKAGYKVTVETANRKLQGKTRPFYRVLAKTQKGAPTTIEVVLDGVMYVPVAIKVAQDPNGKNALTALWTSKWNVGGKIDPKSFRIPKQL